MQFSHLLVEWTEDIGHTEAFYLHTHTVKNITHGFSHWGVDFNMFFPIQVFLKPKILLLKRIMPYPSLILNTTRMKSHKM